MCRCRELPSVVGNADAMRHKLRDSLRMRACDRDLYLWQCTECGMYWEAVPCSPYWCMAGSSDVGSGWSDQNPYHNNGYLYQKCLLTMEDWLKRAKQRNQMRQARLLDAVQAYRQLGYQFVDSGGEDGVWVEFDRPMPEVEAQGQMGLERVLVGIDFVGRRYYETRLIVDGRTESLERAGEDAGGPWIMG